MLWRPCTDDEKKPVQEARIAQSVQPGRNSFFQSEMDWPQKAWIAGETVQS